MFLSFRKLFKKAKKDEEVKKKTQINKIHPLEITI